MSGVNFGSRKIFRSGKKFGSGENCGSEIHGECASIAHRKVFARPESFCAANFFLPISIENCLETIRSVWKVSGLSGELPDYLERF